MQKLFLLVLLQISSISVVACEVCGSSTVSYQTGMLSFWQKHLIGLSYSMQSYHSKPHNSGLEHYSQSSERFQTIQLWAQLAAGKRFRVSVYLPFQANDRTTAETHTRNYGPGDISLLGGVFLLNTLTAQTRFRHALQISAGVKFPTGKYNAVQNGLMLNNHLQTGTGSFAWPLNINYTMRRERTGLSTEIALLQNGSNKLLYQPGNKLNALIRFFAVKPIRNYSLIPSLGALYEKQTADRQEREPVDFTGGQRVFACTDLDLYFKKTGCNLHAQIPVYQQAGEGLISCHPRLTASFIYQF